MAKKILLIQIRSSKSVADQEYRCFRALLPKKVILKKINLCNTKIYVEKAINDFDAIFVGGSRYSVLDKFPQRRKLLLLIKRVIARRIPFLGICFGFELLTGLSGGRVVRDKAAQEYGSRQIYITSDGKNDVVFRNLPDKFIVQQGHEWRVSKVSKDILLLAKGQKVFYQAVKIKDAPIYGVQFHPELNEKEILNRLKLYKSGDFFQSNSYPRKPTNLKASPFGPKIIKNFVRHVL